MERLVGVNCAELLKNSVFVSPKKTMQNSWLKLTHSTKVTYHTTDSWKYLNKKNQRYGNKRTSSDYW